MALGCSTKGVYILSIHVAVQVMDIELYKNAGL